VTTERRKGFVGSLRRDEGEELPLVRDVERVEAEDLAGAAHRLVHRDVPLDETDPDLRPDGDLVQRRRHAAARRVAENVDRFARDGEKRLDEAWSGAVSETSSVSKRSPSRTDMMAIPWTAISPETSMTSPAARGRARS